MDMKIDEKLQQIGEDILQNSVVRIMWQKTGKKKDEDNITPRGSGFFVGQNLVATNIHCIVDKEIVFTELVSKNSRFAVEGVVAYDIENDLTILKVNGSAEPIPLGNSDSVQVGDVVCAVGFPGDEDGVLTQGTIHEIRESDKRLQIDKYLKPGYSGGPVINSDGEVIGVAANIFIGLASYIGEGRSANSQAIPVSRVQNLLSRTQAAELMEKWNKNPHIQGYAKGFIEGQTKLKQGKLNEALECLNAAIEVNPDLAELYINRAGLKVLTDEPEAAIKDCNAAIKLKPDFVEAYLNRAGANLTLEQYDKAIADCDVALSLIPNLVQAYVCRATAKSEIGQHEEALADFDAALNFNPDSEEIYLSRASLRYEHKDYAGAIEDFDKLISINPEFSNFFGVYASRGLAKYYHKDYEGAIKDYDNVIETSPKEAVGYYNRGMAKYKIGSSHANKRNKTTSRKYYNDAIDDFNEAIKIDPKADYVYYDRGLTKRQLSEFEEALKDLDIFIELNPKHCCAYFNRGLVKRNLGSSKLKKGDIFGGRKLLQEASNDYTQGIKLNHHKSISYHNRGYAKYRLGKSYADQRNIEEARGQYQESIDDYTEAIKTNPKYTLAYEHRVLSNYLLGKCEDGLGNSDAAAKLYRATIADSDEYIRLRSKKLNADIIHKRGAANAALGEYEQAVEDFNQAIQIKPKHALSYFERGIAKQALGQHEAAEQDYAKAKELDPNLDAH